MPDRRQEHGKPKRLFRSAMILDRRLKQSLGISENVMVSSGNRKQSALQKSVDIQAGRK
jgi:hypothetical protein